MLQTSPYWLSQYGGNVATAALAAAAATNPALAGSTTPFDIYYRQAAAALQQKHQQNSSSMVPTSVGDSLSTQSLSSTGSTPLYMPTATGAPDMARFNPLYMSSLPPTSGSMQPHNLLMPLNPNQAMAQAVKDSHNSGKESTERDNSGRKHSTSKSPSPSVTPEVSQSTPSTPPNAPNFDTCQKRAV